jgi:hypothetical protein
MAHKTRIRNPQNRPKSGGAAESSQEQSATSSKEALINAAMRSFAA